MAGTNTVTFYLSSGPLVLTLPSAEASNAFSSYTSYLTELEETGSAPPLLCPTNTCTINMADVAAVTFV